MSYLGNLARALAGKASTFNTETLAALLQGAESTQFGRVGTSYRALSEQGFIRNVFAHRAISDIAGGAASIRYRLFRGEDEVPDHPLALFLKRPNFRMSGPAFLKRFLSYFLLAGNSFVRAVTAGEDETSGDLVALWPLRPDNVEVTRVPTGVIRGTRYLFSAVEGGFDLTVSDAQEPRPILHMMTFHPLNELQGLSPLMVARQPIDRHNLAEEWNSSLIRNGCKPPGSFVVNPGKDRPVNLTPEQRKDLREQIDQMVGPQMGTRPFVLEGGLNWVQMGLSPLEMDWDKAKTSAARDVGNALGYPPFLYGIPGDNTYSNQREARLALWENTIIPLALLAAAELTNFLAPRFPEPDLELRPDFDSVPALALMRERVWSRVTAAKHITINEKRDETGFDERSEPEADVIFIPATDVPIDAASIPKELAVTEDDLDDQRRSMNGTEPRANGALGA